MAFGSLLLAMGAFYGWSRRDAHLYRVVAVDHRYAVGSLKISRGHSHEMWDADPAEITFGRWLGSSALTRRIRPKFLSPVSWFRAETSEPSLGFTGRFKGEISDNDLLGLTARLVSGTNEYELRAQSSQRNWARRSFIKCWTMESTPPTNRPLELRIGFASGAGLARIAIPASRQEFARPVIGPLDGEKHVASILGEFLECRKSADQTLKSLHELYEEYNAPNFITRFEMLYYDPTGTTSGDGTVDLATRLKSEALEWLRDTTPGQVSPN